MKTSNLFNFAIVLLMLFSCGTSKNVEKKATRYADRYHVLSDSICEIVADDTSIDTQQIGFVPVLRPGETEMTKREFNKQFRHYKREVKKNRKDKRTKERHDFIIDKKEVKQTGRTERVEVRQENSFFSGNFYPKILLSIVLITFVVLVIYFLIKRFNK